jgi:predicted DCC family thiol-disulfide oxidoreductase YuxK
MTIPLSATARPDPAIYPLTLYYDGACPVCNGEMRNLMLRNTAGLLRFVDISAPDFCAFPGGTDMDALMGLMHAKRADGRLAIGAEALRLAYRGAQLGWLARVMELPVLRQLCDQTYPVFARNRYRIPRPVARLLFETALRRAAERRAGASPCRDSVCGMPEHRGE